MYINLYISDSCWKIKYIFIRKNNQDKKGKQRENETTFLGAVLAATTLTNLRADTIFKDVLIDHLVI